MQFGEGGSCPLPSHRSMNMGRRLARSIDDGHFCEPKSQPAVCDIAKNVAFVSSGDISCYTIPEPNRNVRSEIRLMWRVPITMPPGNHSTSPTDVPRMPSLRGESCSPCSLESR